ncbi:MAG TPA: hypothetical protein DCO65_05080 [Spartobacteria bacterium]|jgi:hypothetical protein|nr:hypothetical protein [Spartobacteria bacterium]
MDVFKFRNRIISDYHRYVSSFISISQPRLREFVDECFTSGKLWPDPLIQLNPTFKPGKAVDDRRNVTLPGIIHADFRLRFTSSSVCLPEYFDST